MSQTPSSQTGPAPQAVNPADFLDRTLLFGSLDPQFKQLIAERLEQRAFRKGDVVFSEGDRGDSLYLIVDGSCQVYVVDRELGIEFEVARLGSHEVFGEMALLTGAPRSASVRALTPVRAYMLRANVFQNILLNAPQVSLSVCRVLARRLDQVNKEKGINVVNLSQYRFDRGVYSLVPHHVLKQKRAVPLSLEDDTVTMAMVNAHDATAIDELRRMLRGYRIKPVAITSDDYDRFLSDVINPAIGGTRNQTAGQQRPSYAGGRPAAAKIEFLEAGSGPASEDERSAQVSGDEIKRLVESIFSEAVELEASDIHIEPHEKGVDVRYRVEGSLQKREGMIERRFLTPLVSRIKVISSLDISEKRRPQDGRISLMFNDRKIDMRLSTMPTSHGEKLVMRLLDPSNYLVPLSRLMLARQVADAARRMIFSPHGVIFVTGPTGSGKTTTLYSSLHERQQNSSHLNICTVEDPVEYDMAGVNQVQINPNIDLGFAEVLRTFLRQDPDIILIGEIRDIESAKIAMEAALTGHLVLTSLHTNNALGVVDRLKQMGLPPYLIANSMLGSIAQRLLRRICPACAAPQETSPTILKNLADAGVYDPNNPFHIYGGAGCDQCNGTGFKGRVGMYELLQMNGALRQAVATEMEGEELRRLADRKGLVGFNRYGRFLLQNGITTPSEVLRNLQHDSGDD